MIKLTDIIESQPDYTKDAFYVGEKEAKKRRKREERTFNKAHKMDDHEKNIQYHFGRFENANHKQKAKEYLNIRKQIDKVNTATQQTDIVALYHLSQFLKDKSYKDATQNDIMEWERLLQKHYSESSIRLFEAKIKRFYKYIAEPKQYMKGNQFQKNIEFPDCVSWISTTLKNGELPIDSIISEKEIKQLLDGCKDAREQCIIGPCLIDAGLRVSELKSLKIKNIGFDRQLGAFFILPKKAMGLKTGQRKIQLFLIPSSTAYIKEYLNHHIRKNDPEAYFIYSDSNFKRSETDATKPMSSNGIWKIVTRIVRNSGVKKDIHPHTLRHVSATFCSMRGFNEAMMRERFGWSRSSNMPSHYTHLASKDTSDYIKKLLGIKEDVTPDSILQPILCPNCTHENPPTHIFCSKCSTKLNIKKEDLGVDATTTGLATQEMLQDPQFREFYNEMLLATWEKYKEMKEKK